MFVRETEFKTVAIFTVTAFTRAISAAVKLESVNSTVKDPLTITLGFVVSVSIKDLASSSCAVFLILIFGLTTAPDSSNSRTSSWTSANVFEIYASSELLSTFAKSAVSDAIAALGDARPEAKSSRSEL